MSMFYKVIYDNKVVDVLDNLTYLKYQTKHDRMVLCGEDGAQAIMSSDGECVWHVDGWYEIPVSGYDTVKLELIDEYEYKKLKALCNKTPEEIIDEFVVLMLGNEMGLLIDSLKRLYENNRIDKYKVIELCNSGKIANDQMERVLSN